MPGFMFKEGRHFVSYVTGPSHVLLGVRFVHSPVEPALVRLPARGPGHAGLEEGRIRAAVMDILAACQARGTPLFAAEIVYIENDTTREALYHIAAELLTRHYLEGGVFSEQ